jgi:hypothetical protein
MTSPILQETTQLLSKDFELKIRQPEPTEEDVVLALAYELHRMMETNLEQMFTTLYLMDVDESKVHKILRPDVLQEEPANIQLARLVIERLKRKAITKLASREGFNGEWMEE